MSRDFNEELFRDAFKRRVIENEMCEGDDYYPTYRIRYQRTLERICKLDLPSPANILEVGGGQMLLLCNEMFGDGGMLLDVNDEHASAIRRHGLQHGVCDLLRDDIDHRNAFDLVVLCEVIEHIPIPAHLVLEKIYRWLKPGGYVFLTTPNLYRLRNIVRLITGKRVFVPLTYPPRGRGIGHSFEMAADHMQTHLERAGFTEHSVEITQLANTSRSRAMKLARFAMAPVMAARPLWKENLVGWGRKPSDATDRPTDPGAKIAEDSIAASEADSGESAG